MIVFYIQNLDESTAILEEEEFVHCIKVLRHQVGDRIEISNGKGIFASAIIQSIAKRSAILEIQNRQSIPGRSKKISLAIAAPKSKNRWDFLLEKVVETGVDRIIPIHSSNSERNRINIDRAEKIIRSAALQSRRAYHPIIQDSISFKELVETTRNKDMDLLLAHYKASHDHILDHSMSHNEVLIVIGPEGDFSPEEYDLAVKNKFKAVNISHNRLRTETAAINSICLLNESQRMDDH